MRDRFRKYDTYQDVRSARRPRPSDHLVRTPVSSVRSQQRPLGADAVKVKPAVSHVASQTRSLSTNPVANRPAVRAVSRQSLPVSETRSSAAESLALKAVGESVYNAQFDDGRSIYVAAKKSRSAGIKMFYALGTLTFIGAMFFSARAFLFNKQAHDQVGVLAAADGENIDEQGVEQGTGEQPAEHKPAEYSIFNYNVSPDKPRFIKIPSQNVFARVKELGETASGAIDAPWNIHDVGWYNGTIVPGSKNGVSLMLGHVSGKSMPGVFKNIGKLEAGQVVEVELGNGEVIKYGVDKIEQYDLESIDMAKILYEIEKGQHSLRLMTCSGRYDSASREYMSRTVVYATEIK